MNPMVGKEFRERMRDRRAGTIPSIYLALLGAAALLAYFFAGMERWSTIALQETQAADIGLSLFLTIAYTQLGVLLLIAPILSAGSITIEKEQRTFASLLTSLLTPFDIWAGKFASALLYQMLLLVSGLPILALALAFGGIGLREIAVATGATVLMLSAMSMVGIYCSSFFRRSVHATAVTYTVVIGLTMVTTIATILLTTGREETVWAPMYLNPFYVLTIGLGGEWRAFAIGLGIFTVIASVATLLALRNIARSGEALRF